MSNPFERLVEVACLQHWCWRIPCTTCGCMPYRRALELIGEGRLPEVIEEQTVMDVPISEYEEIAYARDKALARWCANANLKKLSALPMPDWLGCMGLVLYRFGHPTFNAERIAYREQISVSWAEQFLEMLDPSAKVVDLLKNCANKEDCLSWQDLTPIEEALLRPIASPLIV